MKPFTLTALLLPLLASTLPAQSPTSTFPTSNDSWTTNGFAYSGHLGSIGPGSPAPFDPTEGQPPGSLRLSNLYAETCVQAPAPFLGDKSSWYGGTLAWDIVIRFSDGVDYPAAMLVGADRTLFRVLPAPPLGA
jgi:hypothetical protein